MLLFYLLSFTQAVKIFVHFLYFLVTFISWISPYSTKLVLLFFFIFPRIFSKVNRFKQIFWRFYFYFRQLFSMTGIDLISIVLNLNNHEIFRKLSIILSGKEMKSKNMPGPLLSLNFSSGKLITHLDNRTYFFSRNSSKPPGYSNLRY